MLHQCQRSFIAIRRYFGEYVLRWCSPYKGNFATYMQLGLDKLIQPHHLLIAQRKMEGFTFEKLWNFHASSLPVIMSNAKYFPFYLESNIQPWSLWFKILKTTTQQITPRLQNHLSKNAYDKLCSLKGKRISREKRELFLYYIPFSLQKDGVPFYKLHACVTNIKIEWK